MAFCYASTDDAIRDSEAAPGNKRSTTDMKNSQRLVCVGYNTNGTVTIKGLAIPSLTEIFSLNLIEVPTCVRVASRRPFLAIGFADGALNMVCFGQDRCAGGCDDRWNTASKTLRVPHILLVAAVHSLGAV